MAQAYQLLLSECCHNNLISLYLEVAEQPRFMPFEKRNQYLLKRLKAQYKKPINKPIKSDIKKMIVRAQSVSLEGQLLKLNRLIANNQVLKRAETNWVDFLVRLTDSGYVVEVSNLKQPAQENRLYVVKDEIFNTLEQSGTVGPLSLFAYLSSKDDIDKLSALIEQDECYNIDEQISFDNHAKLSLVQIE
ncbi:DUF2913 family protein [Shewanella sp. UCD-KL12]|uniref:DUF2913 family protein n=1 Tax=Shewanella sp. UCD-KL12 TaxID=1917163 RepID=UPI00097029AB|nr:DUF2913 family protein [Shewanella sp. UCD-KL12]